MIAWLRNFIALIVSLTVAYTTLYAVYRATHIETWGDDPVVVFGSRASYLFFRPAVYVDERVTDMRFHLGPHREPGTG